MTEREKLIQILNTPAIHLRLEANPDANISNVIADFFLEIGVRIPVRCKDCKSWEQYNACDGTKPHRCMNYDAMFYKRTKPDGFCSYGERKDNEETQT